MRVETVVVKIGGSLLRNARTYIQAAEDTARLYDIGDQSVILVVSAAYGVTDLLLQASRGSMRAYEEASRLYMDMCEEICSTMTLKRVRDELNELKRIVELSDGESPALTDLILSYGERVSKMILRESLEIVGLRVFEFDARDLIVTDYRHGDASIDYDLTRPRLEKMHRAALEAEAVPVIEGFVGSTPSGRVTTLGRGGSDYTATAIASLLRAERADLVTDVDGIMSADPKQVPSARLVEDLSYTEALEASLYGVKRMNPKALEPPIRVSPVRVRIGSWRRMGTTISDKPASRGFKIVAISQSNRQSVALIGELKSRTESLSRVVEALRRAGLDVEGLEMPPGRPVLRVYLSERDVASAARLLHDELILGG